MRDAACAGSTCLASSAATRHLSACLHLPRPPPHTPQINQFEGYKQKFLGGVTVLEYYSLDGLNKWALMSYELLFFVAFFCLTWLTLSVKRYRR